ncbi:MAG TPA: phage holin family protein [Arachnia sp.]|nr:phage holin family protein [Arachnia sp.]
MSSLHVNPNATAGDPYGSGYRDPSLGAAPLGRDPEEVEDEASYARYRAEDRSLGEIAGDLFDNATTLIRQEVELAKVEAKQSAFKAGKGVGMYVGAGVTALLGLIALTLALWWGLAVLIGTRQDPELGWSGLIVAVIWLAIAAMLAAAGKNEFTNMRGLDRTADTVNKIPNAVTGNEEKNR